jgi:hypothetical protein
MQFKRITPHWELVRTTIAVSVRVYSSAVHYGQQERLAISLQNATMYSPSLGDNIPGYVVRTGGVTSITVSPRKNNMGKLRFSTYRDSASSHR